jgi:hypothetical protein
MVLAELATYAQVLNPFNTLNPDAAGLRLYGVTISSTYYTGSSAYYAGSSAALQNVDVVALQSSAALGWSKQGQQTSVSIMYSPSYVRQVEGSSYNSTTYNSLNHAFTFSANKKLHSKWTLGGSVNAVLTDFNQLLFSQNQYSNAVKASASFEDLSGSILNSGSDNTELNNLLNAPPIASGAETAYVYGGREFSAAGSMSLAYASSPRSTYRISMYGVRSQYLSMEANTGPSTAVPNTTSGMIGIGWSWSIDPRTTLALDTAGSRTISPIQDAYVSRASISISRTLSQRWFARIMGGVGILSPVRTTNSITAGPSQEWGGSIGFKTSSNTFSVSANRSVSDMYGLGANANLNGNGGWIWHRPGRSISISSNFGFYRLLGPTFQHSGSLTAQVGFDKKLGAHTTMTAAYAYVQYPQQLLMTGSHQTQNGITVSLGWTPTVIR